MDRKSESTNFTYLDPRFIDGDSDAVAGEAAIQAQEVANLFATALSDVWVMARNAALTEYYKDAKVPVMTPEEQDEWWRANPQAKALLAANRYFGNAVKKLNTVSQALNYDPSAPLPEEE